MASVLNVPAAALAKVTLSKSDRKLARPVGRSPLVKEVAIVFDVSGSMNGFPESFIDGVLARVQERLEPAFVPIVIPFGAELRPGARVPPLYSRTYTLDEMREGVRGISPLRELASPLFAGMTYIDHALAPLRTRRWAAVVVVTDGELTIPGTFVEFMRTFTGTPAVVEVILNSARRSAYGEQRSAASNRIADPLLRVVATSPEPKSVEIVELFVDSDLARETALDDMLQAVAARRVPVLNGATHFSVGPLIVSKELKDPELFTAIVRAHLERGALTVEELESLGRDLAATEASVLANSSLTYRFSRVLWFRLTSAMLGKVCPVYDEVRNALRRGAPTATAALRAARQTMAARAALAQLRCTLVLRPAAPLDDLDRTLASATNLQLLLGLKAVGGVVVAGGTLSTADDLLVSFRLLFRSEVRALNETKAFLLVCAFLAGKLDVDGATARFGALARELVETRGAEALDRLFGVLSPDLSCPSMVGPVYALLSLAGRQCLPESRYRAARLLQVWAAKRVAAGLQEYGLTVDVGTADYTEAMLDLGLVFCTLAPFPNDPLPEFPNFVGATRCGAKVLVIYFENPSQPPSRDFHALSVEEFRAAVRATHGFVELPENVKSSAPRTLAGLVWAQRGAALGAGGTPVLGEFQATLRELWGRCAAGEDVRPAVAALHSRLLPLKPVTQMLRTTADQRASAVAAVPALSAVPRAALNGKWDACEAYMVGGNPAGAGDETLEPELAAAALTGFRALEQELRLRNLDELYEDVPPPGPPSGGRLPLPWLAQLCSHYSNLDAPSVYWQVCGRRPQDAPPPYSDSEEDW